MDIKLPKPLFQSYYLKGKHLCLLCANQMAESMLYESIHVTPVIPVCTECNALWTFHSYNLLKRINVFKLFFKLLKFKLLHPFSSPKVTTIVNDVRLFVNWSKYMRKVKSR